MKTEDLIVQLARSATPVAPLERPAVRLARWIALALPFAAVCVFIIGPRHDLWTAIHRTTFMALATGALVTALLSAGGALVLGVPGAEHPPVERVLPLLAGAAWVAGFTGLLIAGGDPVPRVLALPVHALCVIEIAGFGLVTGWMLFAMLRHAAPIRLGWSAALASLAGTALGAAATQFLCPIDDPAHLLVGHALPVALLAMLGTVLGRRSLDWLGV